LEFLTPLGRTFDRWRPGSAAALTGMGRAIDMVLSGRAVDGTWHNV